MQIVINDIQSTFPRARCWLMRPSWQSRPHNLILLLPYPTNTLKTSSFCKKNISCALLKFHNNTMQNPYYLSPFGFANQQRTILGFWHWKGVSPLNEYSVRHKHLNKATIINEKHALRWPTKHNK